MKKSSFTLLIMFVFFGFVNAQNNADFKITTWNAEWLSCTGNGPVDEELQMNNIATVIKALGSDIVALQEVGTSSAYATIDLLVGKLGAEWAGHIVPWKNGNCNQSQGIVFKKSKVQLISSALITNGGSFSNWSSGRYPALYNVNLVVGGQLIPVSLINIHAKAMGDEQSYMRRKDASAGLKALFDSHAYNSKRVILLGDFNDYLYGTQCGSCGYDSPYKNFMDDTQNYKGLTANLTVPYYGNPAIDNIVISNELFDNYKQNSATMEVGVTEAILDYRNTTSDHTPVSVTLSMIPSCKTTYSESFAQNLGDFTPYSVTGNQTWEWRAIYGAYITGFASSTNYPNEDWLISPAFDLSQKLSATLTFDHALNFSTQEGSIRNNHTLWVSNNYNSGTPENATWTQLTIPTMPSGNNWTYVKSGEIELPAQMLQNNVHFAFKYISNTETAATWEIRELNLDMECESDEIIIEPQVECNEIFYETFIESLGLFTPYNVNGSQTWNWTDSYGASISGYAGGSNNSNEDWLISPSLNLSDKKSAILTFEHALNYSTQEGSIRNNHTLWVSSNYTNGAPANATWTQITMPNMPAGNNFTYVESGNIVFPAEVMQDNVRFAFKYISNSGTAATWQVRGLTLSMDFECAATDTLPPVTETIATMTTTQETVVIRLVEWTGNGYITANGTLLNNGGQTSVKAGEGGIVELVATGNVVLTTLNCNNNSLTALDVSGLTNLQDLRCHLNSLTTLDLSSCTALTFLRCQNNSLTTLDVSGLTNLQDLSCAANSLTLLDVSGLTNLQTMYCGSNMLTTLDVSGLANLQYLSCYNNLLTTLDVSGCTSLSYLDAEEQTIECSVPTGNILINPILYKNPNGVEAIQIGTNFYAKGAEITIPESGVITFTTTPIGSEYPFSGSIIIPEKLVERTIATMTTTQDTVSLAVVWSGTGNITANGTPLFNGSGNYNYIAAGEGGVVELVATGGVALTTLYCYDNSLTILNISNCTALTDLRCQNNSLTTLNVSGLTNLQALRCYNNSLTMLNVNGLANLQTLYCNSNSLTTLNVSGLTSLQSLQCNDNLLTILDVNGLTNLQLLLCDNNSLTTLNVNACTALTTLSCSGNSFTTLDVSKNTNLQAFYCGDNLLTTLDVSGLTNLQNLSCEINSLTTLDVSKHTNLRYLSCRNNSLTTLNISGCTALAEILAGGQEVSIAEAAATFVNPVSFIDINGATKPIMVNSVEYATGAMIPTPANGAVSFSTNTVVQTGTPFSGTFTVPVPVYGCTNPLANNYNSNATIDDGSCVFDTIIYIYGCTDPAANNYNPQANRYDNSCTYDTIFTGCTDTKAINYDNTATVDDGSCVYEVIVPGCTDVLAQNYDTLATTNDGSCKYETVIWGCRDSKATNYNPAATKDDGYCEYLTEIKGCTDKTALNYAHFATVDDGSCTYPQPEPEVIVYGCTDKYALNYNPYATNDNNTCTYQVIREEISGCTDENAINYNPVATISANICIYNPAVIDVYGCPDPKALNYNSNATIDDKSCVYARPINSYNPPTEDPSNDTIATKPVSACDLNPNLPIDSAKIVSIEIIGVNLLKVLWLVYQNGVEVPFEAEYNVSQNGNTLFYLSIVCKPEDPSGVVISRAKQAVNIVGFTISQRYNIEGLETSIWSPKEDFASKINVYPNPFNTVLNLNIDNIGENVVTIELYSIEGMLQTVYKHTNQVQINTNHFSNGIYLLRVTFDSNRTETIKLIKK